MKYMQTDKRWGGLGYPKKPYYIRNCGCGEVSICNCIIEMEKYKKYTPKTIQPYCKQFADPQGNGTYWSGIPKMMKHYGMTEVMEHQTMKPLWTELAKGGRVAVFLMGSRKAGSKGVHWTYSGHFVCATKYKYKDGKHWVYVKDSYSNSKLRNGWITYEDNMRNDVLKVWSGKLAKEKPKVETPQDKICAEAKSIADSKKYRYMRYDEKPYGNQCPMCHPHDGKNDGTQCIGFAVMCWHHSGIKCKCKPDVFTNQIYNKMLKGSAAAATKTAQERLGIQDVKVIKNGDKTLVFDKLQKGDIVVYFKGDDYRHTAIYIGDGKIADCTSGRKQAIKYGVESYTSMSIKLAIRYTGK